MDGDLTFVQVSNWTEGDDALKAQETWTSTELCHSLKAVQADELHGANEDQWNLGGNILAANRMLNDLEEVLASP